MNGPLAYIERKIIKEKVRGYNQGRWKNVFY